MENKLHCQDVDFEIYSKTKDVLVSMYGDMFGV